jgi:histone deacetylase 1/2
MEVGACATGGSNYKDSKHARTASLTVFSYHHFFFIDFFPGTGHISDVGAKDGTGFSVNAPLSSGITDETYMENLFKPVFNKIMEVFRPGAIVLQCGADSLTGDRLGCFNLTLKGHAACVKYVKSYGVPTLVLGGGGYTIRNVARCWAYETAVLLDREDIPNEIPYNDYYEYYAPDYELHLKPEPMENKNSPDTLNSVRDELLKQLQDLQGVPSVAMHQVPPAFTRDEAEDDDDDDDLDERDIGGKTRTGEGSRRQHGSELYDSVD